MFTDIIESQLTDITCGQHSCERIKINTIIMLKNILENSISKKEKYILINYIICGETFQEIGDKLNISRQRVKQIHDNGIKKLKKKVSKEM